MNKIFFMKNFYFAEIDMRIQIIKEVLPLKTKENVLLYEKEGKLGEILCNSIDEIMILFRRCEDIQNNHNGISKLQDLFYNSIEKQEDALDYFEKKREKCWNQKVKNYEGYIQCTLSIITINKKIYGCISHQKFPKREFQDLKSFYENGSMKNISSVLRDDIYRKLIDYFSISNEMKFNEIEKLVSTWVETNTNNVFAYYFDMILKAIKLIEQKMYNPQNQYFKEYESSLNFLFKKVNEIMCKRDAVFPGKNTFKDYIPYYYLFKHDDVLKIISKNDKRLGAWDKQKKIFSNPEILLLVGNNKESRQKPVIIETKITQNGINGKIAYFIPQTEGYHLVMKLHFVWDFLSVVLEPIMYNY